MCNNVCKYWGEYDSENGREYEYCKLVKKSCYCCGTKDQCNFKWALDKEKRIIINHVKDCNAIKFLSEPCNCGADEVNMGLMDKMELSHDEIDTILNWIACERDMKPNQFSCQGHFEDYINKLDSIQIKLENMIGEK